MERANVFFKGRKKRNAVIKETKIKAERFKNTLPDKALKRRKQLIFLKNSPSS